MIYSFKLRKILFFILAEGGNRLQKYNLFYHFLAKTGVVNFNRLNVF